MVHTPKSNFACANPSKSLWRSNLINQVRVQSCRCVVSVWARSRRAGQGRAGQGSRLLLHRHTAAAAHWLPRSEPRLDTVVGATRTDLKKKKWRLWIRWNPPFPSWMWTTRRWLCRPLISTDQANSVSWNKCKPSGGTSLNTPAARVDLLLYLQQVRAADTPGLQLGTQMVQ